MGRVLWSAEAEGDLQNIARDVREQIKRNAEVTLPDIRSCTGQIPLGILWHRGITHEQEDELDGLPEEDGDGIQPWDYYLFYQEQSPEEFEVLAVLSTYQIANMRGHIAWELMPDAMAWRPPDADDEQALLPAHTSSAADLRPGSAVQ
jgi:hypothetical protein